MMKLMISAAALIAVAAFTVPASADLIGGGPRVNAEGKCWKDKWRTARLQVRHLDNLPQGGFR
jgi:hypothetical protein